MLVPQKEKPGHGILVVLLIITGYLNLSTTRIYLTVGMRSKLLTKGMY